MKLSPAAARILRIIAVCCSLVLTALPAARAATIINQSSGKKSTKGFTLWTSESTDEGSTLYGRSYDRFQSDADVTVGTVAWEGAYVQETDPAANPASPNTTAFEITLWTDRGGQPGETITTTRVALADASPQSEGTLDFAFSSTVRRPVPLFSYSAALPATFTVAAGQTYWLSITSISTSQQPAWAWMSGDGGDGNTVQDFAGQRYQRQYDRTFKLTSLDGQILTDVNGRAFAGGAALPLSVSFADPGDGDSIAQVDFLADGQVFASLDANGNPRTSSTEQKPTRKESAAAGIVFQTVYTIPGADRLINIVARALTSLGKTKTSPAVSIQAVSATTNRPPAVNVSSPARARVGEKITAPVTATDPDAAVGAAGRRPIPRDFGVPSGVIKRLEYYLNAIKVKDSAAAPFGFEFTPEAPGTYVLTAIATDGSDLATASAPVRVEVFAPTKVTAAAKGDGTVSEGGGTAKILISRGSGDASTDLTVLYTVEGTAENGVDYQALSDSIVIPAGSPNVKLKIKPIDNADADGTRKLKLKLAASPTGDYTIGSPKKATISIRDND